MSYALYVALNDALVELKKEHRQEIEDLKSRVNELEERLRCDYLDQEATYSLIDNLGGNK